MYVKMLKQFPVADVGQAVAERKAGETVQVDEDTAASLVRDKLAAVTEAPTAPTDEKAEDGAPENKDAAKQSRGKK